MRILSALQLLVFVIGFFNTNSQSKCNGSLTMSEYLALEAIYDATNGPEWVIPRTVLLQAIPWDFNPPITSNLYAPCTNNWAGLTCDCVLPEKSLGRRYAIVSIDLRRYNVTGYISSSIGNLKSLEVIRLSVNNLYGTIPSEIGYLPNLKDLEISNNNLTGTIPNEISYITSLRSLALDLNHLSGKIPENIGALKQLKRIYLNFNNLTNSIPETFYELGNLSIAELFGNSLNGTLSSSIGKLSSMEFLGLYKNQLSGSLPSELFKITKLFACDLSSNNIGGSIPLALGLNRNLVHFTISSNKLNGSIPSSIFQTNDSPMQFISLSSNFFTGSIPTSISNLQSLTFLSLSNNFFSGSIPFELFTLPRLRTLLISVNNLGGSIPTNISYRTPLDSLSLAFNSLTGGFPDELCDVTTLQFLQLNGNRLGGTIPSSIYKLTNLIELSLYNNSMTGTVPNELFSLTKLRALSMYTNNFGGTISSNLSSMVNLQVFGVSDNALTGEFPDISKLSSLGFLSIYNNHFYGQAPQLQYFPLIQQYLINNNNFKGKLFEMSNNISLSLLQSINCGNNMLSGSISNVFFERVPQLTYLAASSNCMEGTLPQNVCNLESTLKIFAFDGAGNNELCDRNIQTNQKKPKILKGVFTSLGLYGSVPSCLFTSTVINVLHLGGNRMTGALPSIPANSVLKDLTVANNKMNSPIPHSIQRHNFLKLDLSRNRFDGTLISDFQVSPGQETLSLAVNRLSGNLPNSFKGLSNHNISTLNILASNIFFCENSEIPSADSSAQAYSCGSFEFNVAAYVTLSVGGFLLLIIGVLVYFIIYPSKLPMKLKNYESSVIKMKENHWIWWKTSSQMLQPNIKVQNSNFNSLMTSQTIFEFKALLITIEIIQKFTLIIGAFTVFVALPIYVGLNSVSSIVSYDYAYVMSIAFLHGYPPLIFVGTFLVVVLLSSMVIVNTLYRIFTKHMGENEPSPTQQMAPMLLVKKYTLIITFHIINITVTLLVNSLYVSSILSRKNITRLELLLIQACLSLFKITWNGGFIPWSSSMLKDFLSTSSGMQNRLIMSIMNFILAPLFATASADESCFYYVFVKPPSSTTSLQMEICTSYNIACSKPPCCSASTLETFSTTSFDQFVYSDACGTTVLTSYVPVLIYAYLSIGFLLPLLRFYRTVVIETENPYGPALTFKEIIPVVIKQSGVQGVDRIVKLILHVTVLLTFGVSAPILGACIGIAIVNDCNISRHFIGRHIALNNLTNQNNSDPSSSNEVLNPISDADKSSSSPSGLQRIDDLEEVRDSWRGLFACYPISVLTICLFWPALMYDMVADAYGNVDGIIVSCCFGGFFASAACINYFTKASLCASRRLETYLSCLFQCDSLNRGDGVNDSLNNIELNNKWRTSNPVGIPSTDAIINNSNL